MQEAINEGTKTIGTAAELISELQINQIRAAIVLTNTSVGGQKITLGFISEAVSGKGIVLSPGERFSDSMDAGYKPTQSRITAISDGAGGELAIHEVIRWE